MSAGSFGAHDVREEIIARSRAGEELAVIERDLIDPTVADEDEKAALWLLAWCDRREAVTWPQILVTSNPSHRDQPSRVPRAIRCHSGCGRFLDTWPPPATGSRAS